MRALTTILVGGLVAAACSKNNDHTAAAPPPAAKPAPAATAAPAPKPPSTGHEQPTHAAMSADKARAITDEAVALFAKPTHDCNAIANALVVTLPIAFPEPSRDEVPALRALVACARDTKRWRAEIHGALGLLALGDDDVKTPAKIVSALAEMGEYDKALKAAGELAKKFPRSASELTAALTFVYCRAEAWDQCVKVGTAALDELAKLHVPATDDGVVINRFLRDLGWIVVGRPKDAIADLSALERARPELTPRIDPLEGEARRALERGYYLEVVPLPQVPLGVYHLMGKGDTGALVTIKLRDQRRTPRTFRVEAEIDGVTERSSNTIEIPPGQTVVRWVNPPLKMDFDAGKVRSPRPSQLALKIVEVAGATERPVIDETLDIEVLPRDYLPLKRRVGADSLVPTYGYVGAWVTSNDPSVDAFLGKAKVRAPGHNFVGEQDATIPQVEALYDELKARGVSYVMDPEVTSEQSFVQRTRLPAEVLASTNAQCLEGTLLFASLMEAIGLKPIIVLVPGHAFVGWHTVDKDGVHGEPMFVETTMVGAYGFADAVKVANHRVAQEIKAGTFQTGASTMIDVAQIRSQGFTAQPL